MVDPINLAKKRHVTKKPPTIRFSLRTKAFLLALLVATSGGCKTVQPVIQTPETLDIGYTVISDSLAEDASMDAMIAPFREEMESRMLRVIGTSSARLLPSEGLGDLVTDAMLHKAESLWQQEADFAVTNSGGLRNALPEGDITLGMVYEVMPFDNALVLATYTGEQVIEIAQSMARNSPQPVSGITFSIQSESAEDVLVQGRPVDPEADYYVVTIDYLVDGGGWMETLWSPKSRNNSGYFLRDTIAEYIQSIPDAGYVMNYDGEARIREIEE